MRTILGLLNVGLLLALPTARAESVSVQGITEGISDVVLSSSVPGIVSAWKFKEGDYVESGQVVIELDGKLESLEADRRRLIRENKRTEWDALRKLSEKNSISVKKEELDKAETDYRIAAVECDIAAELLSKRSIKAPCSGYISEIVRDPGEAAEEYQPIVRVVDTRQCYFTCNIDARLAGRLKPDQLVKLEIDGSNGPVTVAGKVVFLSPVVDPASGLQRVRVLFDNADASIRPGVAGRMSLD